jgi:hypothetical protein
LKDVLQKQFSRLSEIEKQVISMLAQENTPIDQFGTITRKKHNSRLRFTHRTPIFITAFSDRKTRKSLQFVTDIAGVYKNFLSLRGDDKVESLTG